MKSRVKSDFMLSNPLKQGIPSDLKSFAQAFQHCQGRSQFPYFDLLNKAPIDARTFGQLLLSKTELSPVVDDIFPKPFPIRQG